MPPLIIDAHCHAGAGDGLSGPWNTRAPLTAHLRRSRAAGIARTVLFAALHTDYGRANEEVARIVSRRPGQFYGFAFVHPRRDAGRVAALVGRAAEQWGFCGIKVHGKDAHATREVAEVARRWRLPLLWDVVGEVERAGLLAGEYPDVNLILPHLGSFGDDWRAHQATIDLMLRLPNVYTDSSGVKRFDYLVQLIRRVGPERLLFGSDGPWLHPGVELAKITALGLPPAAQAAVLGGTFLRLTRQARNGDAGRWSSPPLDHAPARPVG